MRKNVQRDQVLGHADEADGIEEYDNPLPDWWLGLFWVTIVFALGYTLDYHFLEHRSPQKELAAEVAAANRTAAAAGIPRTPVPASPRRRVAVSVSSAPAAGQKP